jgi:hypothetical protein
MTANQSGTKLLFFLAVGSLAGLFGIALDVLLLRGGMPRFGILLLSNLIIGMIAGTLFVQIKVREQEQRQVVEDRLCKIADMNHHVRNALAVVAFYGTQSGSAASAELVSEAVKRIEWTLREVLPKGWNVRQSAPPYAAKEYLVPDKGFRTRPGTW